MANQTTAAELQFSHGEGGIDLGHTYLDEPIFFQAEVGEKAIQFYWQYTSGKLCELPDDTSKLELIPDNRLLGDTNHDIYLAADGSGKRKWRGASVSTVAHLNEVARQKLQPRGAHTLPITLEHGDRDDGAFSARLMSNAISDGVFVFATGARHFMHDMQAHSQGVVSLEQSTVEILQALCQLTHFRENRYPQLERFYGDLLFSYDLTTFQYKKGRGPMYRQLVPTRRDPLLTTIMRYATEGPYPRSFIAEVQMTIEAGPFRYNVENGHVRRERPVVDYYKSIGHLVTA